MPTKHCEDAYELLPDDKWSLCCQSCHEDEVMGYALLEFKAPDGAVFYVCCRVNTALHNHFEVTND